MGHELVDVAGRRLWTSVAGEGTPTVVFEAGGGEASSVWAEIEPATRAANGVRTLVYDRAGLGRSDPPTGGYRIDDEADALACVLDVRGVSRPIVLVAHSYGGFVATLVAARDPRVAGLVLVDANLGAYFADAVVERLLAVYTPQFPDLERQAPALAQVLVPLMRAYPETARRVRAADLPPSLPVIDIVAERSWGETAAENEAMRRAHAEFVAAAPDVREAVLAEGSGHHVMRDRPDVVLDAIARMVRRVRGSEAGAVLG